MKTLEIQNSRISHQIYDYTIDFSVSYDMTGKVYEVKPLTLELPSVAQRMIFGEILEEDTKQKIEDYKNLFSIMLPLGIMNQHTFYTDKFAAIYKNVNQQLIKNNISQQSIHEYAKKDSLEYHILHASLNPSNNPFNYLMPFIEKGQDKLIALHTIELVKQFPQFGIKIITLLTPFIDRSAIKKSFFRHLGNLKTIECRNYLIDELKMRKNMLSIPDIIISLSMHEMDATIQKNLIELYHSDTYLTEEAKRQLMYTLIQLPDAQTFQVVLKMLKENDEASPYVEQILRDKGYTINKMEKSFQIISLI